MKSKHPPYSPCPCGSGKKYKFCCFAADREEARQARAGFGAPPAIIPFQAPFVINDLDAAEKVNDKGMKMLSKMSFGFAEKCFREAIDMAPDIPIGYNNLALCFYLKGDLDKAIQTQEDVLAKLSVPNSFGQAQLARFYYISNRLEEAEKLLGKAVKHAGVSPTSLASVCQSLMLLKRFETILEVVVANPETVDPHTCWYAAVAAGNLEQYDQARSYLKQAQTFHPRRVKTMLTRINKGQGPGTADGHWFCFIPEEIMAQPYILKFQEEIEARDADGFFHHSPAMVDIILTMINTFDKEEDAVSEVVLLSHLKHPRAAEALEKIATGMFGSDELRMEAAHRLIEKGIWSGDETHTLWIDGSWKKLQFKQYGATEERAASSHEIPENLLPAYEKALTTLKQGKFRSAEKQWRNLLKKIPDHPPFHYNLGVALIQQNCEEEAEASLRRAMELEPGYLFPPVQLAMLRLEQGRTEEAREIMDGIAVPDETHPDALGFYFATQVRVCMAEDKPKHALSWLDMGKKAAPDNSHIQSLAEKLDPLEMLVNGFQGIISRRQKKENRKIQRRRKQKLSPDASLEECYGRYDKHALAEILLTLGVGPRKRLKKTELLKRVCRALRTPSIVHPFVGKLDENMRAALINLLGNDRRQPFETFTRAYMNGILDTEEREDDTWGLLPPESVADFLRKSGLIVEATVEHRESVMIPADVALDPDWL